MVHLFQYSLSRVYFTPRDNIRSKLIELIKHERKSIDAAVYMFTDKGVAEALIEAYVRGVTINLVLDQISMSERFGKGSMLQNNGVPLYVHRVSNYNPFSMPIMHHKFFIFGHNALYQKPILWTGSFNCTSSAAKLNDENVIVTDDVSLIQEYTSCFSSLVQRLGVKRYDAFKGVDKE